MFQPFIQLDKIFLDGLVSLKKIYLVSQSYERGYDHFDDNNKTSLLVSDYDNPGLAVMHLNALKHDKYAAIIDLSKEMHYQKMIAMLQGDQYKIYWAIIKSKRELEKRLDLGYKTKLRRYTAEKTNWKIAAGDQLKTQFEVIFGEIFLILKWRSQKVRLKFEEIERY